MAASVSLKLEERTEQGKKVAALRKQGFVPGVVYGSTYGPKTVKAPLPELQKTVRQAGKHHPVQITIGNDTRLAMIKSIDVGPVKQNLRHVSFHVIKQNEKVATEVPVVVTGEGETPAEKAGLVLLKTADTVAIEALPANLPESLAADGEKLVAEGDRLTVADLMVPANVTITSEPETVLVTVFEPAALAAANDAAGGADEADISDVEAENGGDTNQESQSEEDQPGGKKQFEAKGE